MTRSTRFIGNSSNVNWQRFNPLPGDFIQERTAVSVALWCDKGEHAFSAKDPDKRHFSQTREVDVPTGNSYGATTYQTRQEVTDELDICGPCYLQTDPFKTAPKALQPTVDVLEQEDEQYRAGYDAAMEKVLRGKS